MSIEEEAIQACFEYTPYPVKDIRFQEIIEVLKRNNYHLIEQKVASALKTLAPDRKIFKKKNGGKDRFYLIKHREGHTAPNSWVGNTGISDI